MGPYPPNKTVHTTEKMAISFARGLNFRKLEEIPGNLTYLLLLTIMHFAFGSLEIYQKYYVV